MEVATRTVANLLERNVIMLAANGRHGGVGELEQCNAAGEDQERSDLKQAEQTSHRISMLGFRDAAMSPRRIDFVGSYVEEGDQRRHGHARHEDKGRALRNVICASAHTCRGEARAD
jgi:hypothetical protein